MLDWEKLLSRELLTKRAEMPASWAQYEVDEFERGRNDVMNSAVFRTLQEKTQAFPAAGGKSLHTRLTHSLEVSAIGDRMGKMVGLSEKGREVFGEKAEEYARSFSSILSTAGLLHDLGNPPFGHFGESSIGFVLETMCKEDGIRYKGRHLNEVLNPQMVSDLTHFEGNAQALRLVLKTMRNPSPDNLNMTYAVINTLVKYPVSSLEARKDSRDNRIHKFSCFLAEERTLKKIREAAGLTGCTRHPLTFLLEAADDISYLVSDIADAIACDALNILEVRDFFGKELKRIPDFGPEEEEMQKMAVKDLYNHLNDSLEKARTPEDVRNVYRTWLDYVRNWLVYASVHSFFEHYDVIMDGTYAGELLMDSWYYYGVRILKKLVSQFVYDEDRRAAADIAAYNRLNGLLRMFVPAVLLWTAEDEVYTLDPVQAAYIRILPEKLKREYEAEKTNDKAFNLYLRILMVTDFISGLTDVQAAEIYRELEGK